MTGRVASISLVGIITLSLLSSTLYSQKASVSQGAYAELKEVDMDILSVDVDKHLYKPGENITVAGSLTTASWPELDDNTNRVSLLVIDNKDVIVAGGTTETNNAGEYSKTFKLPQEARLGAYVVDAAVQLTIGPSDNRTDSGIEILHKSVNFVVVGHSEYSKINNEASSNYTAGSSTTIRQNTTSHSTILDSNNPTVSDFYSKGKNIRESGVEKLLRSVKFASSEYPIRLDGNEFTIYIVSNSTVTDIFYSTEQDFLSFKVAGETGTRGVAQITLPKDLLGEEIIVSIDGREIAEDSPDVIVTSISDDELNVEINYLHSEHTVRLRGKPITTQSPDSALQVAGTGSQPDSPVVTTSISIFVVVTVAAVGTFLSVHYIVHQKQLEKGGQGTWRRLGFPSSTHGGNRVVDFYCVSCGTRHDLNACPNCGSKIRKLRF